MPCSSSLFNVHSSGAKNLGHDHFFFRLFSMALIQLLLKFTAKFGYILMRIVLGPRC